MKKPDAVGCTLAVILVGLLALASIGCVASAAASTPPSIESESATNVTSEDATLSARINPNGSYTAYQFQIDTSGAYNFTQLACPFELPEYVQCTGINVGSRSPRAWWSPRPAASRLA